MVMETRRRKAAGSPSNPDSHHNNADTKPGNHSNQHGHHSNADNKPGYHSNKDSSECGSGYHSDEEGTSLVELMDAAGVMATHLMNSLSEEEESGETQGCYGNSDGCSESPSPPGGTSMFREGWRKTWVAQHIKNLPAFLQDNEFLHDCHRPQIPSMRQCITSIFSIHTETANIWTHLLGALITTVLAGIYLTQEGVTAVQKIWFSFFFLGAIICMGCSATYHSLHCYSEDVYKWLAKADYCGIIVLIVFSFPPWMNYFYYCDLVTKTAYLIMAGTLGMVCVYFVVLDKFATPEYRTIRAVLFIALGMTGIIPTTHYLFAEGVHKAMLYLPYLLFMGLLYISGGVIYALRVPEKLFPGKFDIWCHSHQFLHVCVIGGVITCYMGINKIAADKILSGCPEMPSQ